MGQSLNVFRLAFGNDVETRYQVDRAHVILSLESDFLTCGPGSLRYARQFAQRREPTADRPWALPCQGSRQAYFVRTDSECEHAW